MATLQVPVDTENNGLKHSRPWGGDRYEMRDAFEFYALLTYVGVHYNNHGFYVEWIDESTGATYPMFSAFFDPLVADGTISNGRIRGHFEMTGSGGYYSIKLKGQARENTWYRVRDRRNKILERIAANREEKLAG